MASGIIGDLKADRYNCPVGNNFQKSFPASSQTKTTANDASYDVPAGFYGVFAGYSVDSNYVQLQQLNANASGTGTLLYSRNAYTSARNDIQCYFNNSLVQNSMIDDERNL
jgi:hypothetical protein